MESNESNQTIHSVQAVSRSVSSFGLEDDAKLRHLRHLPLVLGVLFIVVIIAAGFGLRVLYNASMRIDIQAHVAAACAQEPACMRAVQVHFKSCFESLYPKRGSWSEFSYGRFTSCINQKTGQKAGASIFPLDADALALSRPETELSSSAPTATDLSVDQAADLQKALQQQNDATAAEPPTLGQ